MADKSSIEWTDSTWNPLAGCTKVSPGCANCYAEVMARRLKAMGNINYAGVTDAKGRWSGQIALIPSVLEKPLHWKRPRMIFVNSMSDLFHPTVPSGWIGRVFEVMLKANWHTFQVLTKRPKRMAEILNGWDVWLDAHHEGRNKHIWLGTSVEDQKRADERIPYLTHTTASIRFLSCEPLLGPVDLHSAPIHWVIAGGESGPKARPLHPTWVRSLRDQCKEAGVPFFFKQWGAYLPVGGPEHYAFEKMGKHRTGRVLDGQEWNGFPG